jgi:ribA/ribD-fused uncharacterized protein
MINSFSGEHAFLSNFYQHRICFDGLVFPSVEHAFQAAKTLDRTEKMKIADAPTAATAKRLGRKVVVLRPSWDVYWRYSIMETLLAIKFSDTAIGDLLIATEPHGLIEGNTWHDQVWGDCRCGAGRCLPTGMNLLGWMLVRQRDKLVGR